MRTVLAKHDKMKSETVLAQRFGLLKVARLFTSKNQNQLRLKAGLQYTQQTSAKPRELKRKSVTKHAGVFTKFSCLRDFATRCADYQGVQPVEFTTHKCTSMEENKMALACKKEDRIGFLFFVRCFVCGSFRFSFFFFSFFCKLLLRRKWLKTLTHAIFGL